MDAITGIVLAGGLSTRFGSDKASATLSGKPLVQWVVDALAAGGCSPILVVHAAGQAVPLDGTHPVELVEDLYVANGPLAGMVAGFSRVTTPLCFVASCDIPLLRPGLVPALAALAEGHDVVVPVVEGHPQPLAAIYRMPTCLPVFREAVDDGRLKVVATFDSLRVRRVEQHEFADIDPSLVSFRNANSPAELRALEALVASGELR